jgi:hypothetical protein
MWQCYKTFFIVTDAPGAGSLNKSSCFAPALGVTKFTKAGDMILVALKSDFDAQQTHLWQIT